MNALRLIAVYAGACGLVLWLAGRALRPISRRAALALAFLPLVLAGPAAATARPSASGICMRRSRRGLPVGVARGPGGSWRAGRDAASGHRRRAATAGCSFAFGFGPISFVPGVLVLEMFGDLFGSRITHR